MLDPAAHIVEARLVEIDRRPAGRLTGGLLIILPLKELSHSARTETEAVPQLVGACGLLHGRPSPLRS